MKERPSKLGITHFHVEDVARRVTPVVGTEEGMLTYIQEVGGKMIQEQPCLLSFLMQMGEHIGIINTVEYTMAAMMTYDMIPQEHKNTQVTRDDLDIMVRNFLDHMKEAEDKSKQIDLTWFADKLKKDEPEYSKWMSVMVKATSD